MKYKKNFKTNEQFLDAYEKEAKVYDTKRSTSEEGKVVDELQLRFIREEIYTVIKPDYLVGGDEETKETDSFPPKILEAGCGTGRLLYQLSFDPILDCYGCDPSRNMLDILKQKTVHIDLKVCPIEDMAYPDNMFDVVYTMHVLMHLPDGYNQAFKEMYRVTKPGGLIIMDFPNASSIWNKIAVKMEPNRPRTNLYTVTQLKESFKGYDYHLDGIFSYPRTLYHWKLTRDFTFLFENVFPLGLKFQTQSFVIVRKKNDCGFK